MTNKKYDVTQCALYKCTNQRRLAQLLRLETGELKNLGSLISYHSFDMDKKKGANEKRRITAPGNRLKRLQRRILKLLQRVERPEWLVSGEKGKCYTDNGKAHIQSSYLLAFDIKKFYDNCRREYVYRFFLDYLKVSADVAGILTDIVTFNRGIPTGGPTSQLIAYYAYQNMFAEIDSIAQTYGCRFTLYVDDMTFSSETPFARDLLECAVDRTLRKYGHKPKYKKVKFYSRNTPKPITGTIVTPDHRLDVPNSLQKSIYDGFQAVKAFSTQQPFLLEQERAMATLEGRIHAARAIDSNRFPEIGRLVGQMRAIFRGDELRADSSA